MEVTFSGFISAPIKLAAIINSKTSERRRQKLTTGTHEDTQIKKDNNQQLEANQDLGAKASNKSARIKVNMNSLMRLQMFAIIGLMVAMCNLSSGEPIDESMLRHKTHYMQIVPSTHFQYNEGRQSSESAQVSRGAHSDSDPMASSHIHKRSSALLSSSAPLGTISGGSHYPQLLSSMRPGMTSGNSNPSLRRRMMSASSESAIGSGHSSMGRQEYPDPMSADASNSMLEFVDYSGQSNGNHQVKSAASQQDPAESEVLLRQKQHIQYHDQLSTLTNGKCHKRTLNFCASVLPFNSTTFPNIIGDTNRFEVKRSLPFFGFLAKSSCNKRLDELLCLLLEPPCANDTGLAIPPCKKFCRLALEGCNEYIPATLALSSVFDCRQYPDSSDPNVCVNLAQGSRCAADEFRCPDKTCIPRNWLCDGVRDCVFAADEANCTAPTSGSIEVTSVCSTEEFKCDAKCVPKAWKCDGERDCLDGSDEESCDLRPRCGPDRFKCSDGNGCIPKRWVCDGKAECRDGSDETNCESRLCSENDFKCDNGICIPKLWRCDHQDDCKDASDERFCVYPTIGENVISLNISTPAISEPKKDTQVRSQETEIPMVTTPTSRHLPLEINPQELVSSERKTEKLEAVSAANLISSDISRIIQHESSATSSEAPSPHIDQTATVAEAEDLNDMIKVNSAQELKKFDYDIIPSNGQNLAAINELSPQFASAVQAQNQPDLGAQTRRHLARNQQQTPIAEGYQGQRVPIYKSLFKSFKSGAGSQQTRAGANQQQLSGQRHVVAVARRRRDRFGAGQPVGLMNQTEGQYLATGNVTTSGVTGHKVASYLQMLNGRYNLRSGRSSPNLIH